MDKEANTITYQTNDGTDFKNVEHNNWGEREFTSRDLQYLDADSLVNDKHYLVAMSDFTPGAEFTVSQAVAEAEPFDDDIPF